MNSRTDLFEKEMKFMRIPVIIATTCVLLACSQQIAAQEGSSKTKQELIRELLVVTEARNNAIKMMDSIVGEMNKQYPQMVERMTDADPDLTPAQRQKAKKTLSENQARFSNQLMERIKQRVDIGRIMEGISYSLYDKYFTEDELKDLISFYKTPTGKKTLSVLPQLFAESIQRASEELSPTLTRIFTEIVTEDKERIKHIK
jgi:hypothetical protein